MMRRLLWLLSSICLWQGASSKVAKVFIVAGSTNAEGRASIPHLQALIQNATLSQNVTLDLKHLVDEKGDFVIRKDVYVTYEHEQHGFWIHSPLTVEGFGSDSNHFGPEVEMGHVLGNAYEEPVIIVKAAWPEKTLAKDFRPPSAGGNTGFHWYQLISSVQKTLDKLETILGEPYAADIEGFVWWQGYDDLFNEGFTAEYESNLNHFIEDVRRHLKDDFLPIIVGELGGSGNHASSKEFSFRQMQQRVCEGPPPMNWTTTFVPTHHYVNREKPWIDVNTHYYGRGDTMIGIGGAFAAAILDTIYQYEYVMPKGEIEEGLSSIAGTLQFILMMFIVALIGTLVLVMAVYRRGGLSRESFKDTWSWAMDKIRPMKEKTENANDTGTDELPENDGHLA